MGSGLLAKIHSRGVATAQETEKQVVTPPGTVAKPETFAPAGYEMTENSRIHPI